MKKKICVVTSSRADYYLLRNLMGLIKKSKKYKLNLIVTGAHLSKKYGYTLDSIKKDNFKIDSKIVMNLSSDERKNTIKIMSSALTNFADAFGKIKPDKLMILGDRYEIFVSAIAASMLNIPIIHLHGGEKTEGSFDDQFRHCITKLSHLHFVANSDYKKRVIQLGENPKSVFNVGGLGVDAISKYSLLDKRSLEKKINFKFLKKNFLITYHPETSNPNTARYQIDELLKALDSFSDAGLIFTMPNADPENKIIEKRINFFCIKNSNAMYFKSLGQLIYFSCLKYFDAVIGNSSSGLLEAPSFKISTVNIGERQSGRLKALSVIDCKAEKNQIIKSIKKACSRKFKIKLNSVSNPYGNGGASKKIINILETKNFVNLKKKFFFDIKNKYY
jgi:GDP/UDP-N,N'-diacetylbacillosamine 2-epimerase (hydrolysing)